MGEEESKKKAEVENALPEASPTSKEHVVTEDKTVIPSLSAEEKKNTVDDSKALAIVEKAPDSSVAQKTSSKSKDRDVALAQVENEKRSCLIKAWEESEKTKAENKAQKKLSAIGSWENTKKASVEAQLKKMEEKLEKKKAEYGEKMKNKAAIIHKEAEEKRAMVEAMRGEEILKAEETAAKYRATGHVPKKILGCFGG
ncbi:remorin-like [Magnolia sinica]|uniref:remorin-like n=1 Tax=Magnolia sinica TaxID=86752 RepID=UPI002659005D|nr:remorin-like [Magnolia sinica]